MTTTDYPILAAPRITLATFAEVLHAAGSPAAGAAAHAYAACRSYGVDPAVLLAIFQHESGYGRAGVATADHSWGNERTAPGYIQGPNGFVRFPTWEAGADDAARLLRVYGKSAIRPGTDTSTVRKLPYVWAPAADHNKPAAYGAALVAAIDGYRALEARLTVVPVHPTHTAPLPYVRVRAQPRLSGAIVAQLNAGATATVTATVKGGAYRLPDGRSGSTWVRLSVLNGRPLSAPLYSAALLWRPL